MKRTFSCNREARKGSVGASQGGNKNGIRPHHNIGTVRALELERLALEEDVVEAPGRDGEDSRDAHLSPLDEEREVDGAATRVSGGPRLAGTSVGGVAVRPEALAVDEGLGDGVDGLVAREAEELGDNSGTGDLDEDDVVKSVRVGVSARLDLNLWVWRLGERAKTYPTRLNEFSSAIQPWIS